MRMKPFPSRNLLGRRREVDGGGYRDARWRRTVDESRLLRGVPHDTVYPLVDRTVFDGNGKDYEAVMKWFRNVPHWGLQDDGLTQSQTLGPEWSGRPLALEQLDATSVVRRHPESRRQQRRHRSARLYLFLYRSDVIDPANAGALAQAKEKEASRSRPRGTPTRTSPPRRA